MKPIRTRFTLLILLLTLLLAACAPTAAAPAAIHVTDGLDRTVDLAGPAQKIVSIAPSNTEILFAIGAGEQVIGRDDLSDYPAEATGLPSIGGSLGDINLEEITHLQPDLVLAAEINTPEQVKALEDLGLVVYSLSNPTTLEELYANLEKVGQLTGREKEAADLSAALQARVAAVDQALEGVEDRPLVFYELDSTDPAKPWTAGAGTFIDQLIQRAGGENVTGGQTDPWFQLSQEQLILDNPEVILLGDAAYGVTYEQVAARPGWDAIQAVQTGQVFPFDDDLTSRPGPRLVDGLVQLAKLFHPDLTEGLE
ncbi:MAG: cobalamin-binding protein [Chloroflexi bacterium]|nr:cobalamin-binding protein [Anaerolineaceae bacterium]NMB88350.1 cobalamin-binding protein [Chloroflexota bacterium]